MNAIEERVSDLVAFSILQQAGFKYLIRGLDVWLSPATPRVETDIIGVRDTKDGPRFAVFEAKLGTARQGKRDHLIKQIRAREKSKMFDEVWLIWDVDRPYWPDLVKGHGTIFVQHTPDGVVIRKLEQAPQRPIEYARARELLDARHKQLTCCPEFKNNDKLVFLRCPGCNGKAMFFYPFHLPPAITLEQNKHASFCRMSTERARLTPMAMTTLSVFADGQWHGGVTSGFGERR